jgi:K+-transporting ATPase c subunit
MRAIILNKQIEPLPTRSAGSLVTDYEGILNSNYKQVAKSNFFHSRQDSIFGQKQLIKSRLYNYSSAIDAALKLSVFAIVLAIIL